MAHKDTSEPSDFNRACDIYLSIHKAYAVPEAEGTNANHVDPAAVPAEEMIAARKNLHDISLTFDEANRLDTRVFGTAGCRWLAPFGDPAVGDIVDADRPRRAADRGRGRQGRPRRHRRRGPHYARRDYYRIVTAQKEGPACRGLKRHSDQGHRALFPCVRLAPDDRVRAGEP
jgi:hypothetical protein